MAFTYQNPTMFQKSLRTLNSPKNFEVLNLNFNINLNPINALSQNGTSVLLNDVNSSHSRLLSKPSISSFKDISLIAFLPVCVLVCLFAVVFIVVRLRSWRQERTQLRHLEKVYDILECVCDAPKPVVRASVTNAITVQTDSSTPFFHPVSKIKGSSDHKMSRTATLTITNASEIESTAELRSLLAMPQIELKVNKAAEI
ncbi:hypothetical protein L596_004996 [Steinernema carpocapsae]|uniref:Uncharacterized protein n=1 Tax=Steinernema carpocapsae TaxID=34508 RepID=A0A4U8V157_STECR|nr:hypothetical protein L596_004996 [Steinernema carpocapsae]